jgi:TolB-like protein
VPFLLEDKCKRRVKNIARPVAADAIGAAAVAATPLAAQPGSARRTVLRRTLIPASVVVVVCIAIAASWPWSDAVLSPVPVRTPTSPSMVDSVTAKSAPRLSIVVLPFANLSSDPEQEYFADAVTDHLTTDLSRISESFVIARTTAFTYKGKAIDATQIGRELGVRYLLEGSVRRLGDEVQVNVQLIDAETGAHLWADRFDTQRTNLAKAESEITGGWHGRYTSNCSRSRPVKSARRSIPTREILLCVGGPHITGQSTKFRHKKLRTPSSKLWRWIRNRSVPESVSLRCWWRM